MEDQALERRPVNDTAAKHAGWASSLGLLRLMRPKHWIKNVFVLAPLVFSGEFLSASAVLAALQASVLFCIASSATYVVNDLHDIEYDRRHASKAKLRPLASGLVSPRAALRLLALLYAVLALGWFFSPRVLMVIAVYVVLNFAYTRVLKHQPVIDIFTVAFGFVLRIYAGAVALNVGVSAWMAITTLCLALYLAAIKRRQELSLGGTEGRKVLERYSVALVDRYAEMAATGALIFYCLFVMSAKPQLVITVPLVLFGLFRYWYVVEALDGGESPTDALLSDWPLFATVLAWGVACAWALWPAGG
ncbi:decaprenyl-phosphate phosphoribosyltransferase [Burkholderiales bacterium]|nr:decaprenyl-phosphate phosphoribosyltransferase [Burkholderiales bacterium]